MVRFGDGLTGAALSSGAFMGRLGAELWVTVDSVEICCFLRGVAVFGSLGVIGRLVCCGTFAGGSGFSDLQQKYVAHYNTFSRVTESII